MTNPGLGSQKPGQKKGRPHCNVKFGSVSVPIYIGKAKGRIRYTVSFYREGRRIRRTFGNLEEARKEARAAAQNIQRGLEASNDLRPAERDSYLTATRLLSEVQVPLLSAVQEYVECRRHLPDQSLIPVVEEFARRTRGIKSGVTVPEVLREFEEAKRQDGMSTSYLQQIRSVLGQFASAFPGPILNVQSQDIDQWLRSGDLAPRTRNNRLRVLRVMFSFAKQRSYLPKSETTEAELVSMVKAGDTETEIFTPDQFEKVLRNAPARLIPLLAIGGFAGLRVAELSRLHWDAVDLDRRMIELRAGQAKTASRRLIPICESLAAWVALVPREGMVVPAESHLKQAPALGKAVGVGWPSNVLRHSFISYRLAQIQDAGQVALEAGNSAPIIFRHYRELVTEDAAEKWFGITPPEDWAPPEVRWVKRKLIMKNIIDPSEPGS